MNDNSIDGVLGTRTMGGRIVNADKSTKQWRHPYTSYKDCSRAKRMAAFDCRGSGFESSQWNFLKHLFS